MEAVDEGDKGGSLSRECKLPFDPLDRGSVGDSALNASPWLLVRRSSAIFLRRSSGGSGGWLAMACFAAAAFRFLQLSGRGRRAGARRARRLLSPPGDSNFWRIHRVCCCVGRVLALYQPCKVKLRSP